MKFMKNVVYPSNLNMIVMYCMTTHQITLLYQYQATTIRICIDSLIIYKQNKICRFYPRLFTISHVKIFLLSRTAFIVLT